jgi:PKD repeat protein
MKTMKNLLRLSALILVASFFSFNLQAQSCGCTSTGNQIANGDFSAGNTGFTSSLPYDMNCNAESYGVGSEPRDKCGNSQWINDLWDHTVGNSTGSFLIVDGWYSHPTPRMIWTTTSAVSVVAGQQYTFSFWQVRAISSTSATQTLQMRVDGATVATVNTAGNPANDWVEYCVNWTATTTGTVSVSIWQTASTGNQDYGIDDVYFGTCATECEVDATFGFSTMDGCTYKFNSIVTPNAVTTIVGYSWTFGDGYSSTDANPSHTYNGSGNYEVCLTVYAVNDKGECCQTTVCKRIEVNCRPDDCKAELGGIFLASPINPSGPCEVLVGVSVISANRPIVGYFWDFGDGTTGTSTSSMVAHNFPSSGMYNVCVTVILMSGPDECCSFTICKEVNVICPKPPKSSSNKTSNTDAYRDLDESSSSERKAADNAQVGVFPNPGEDRLNIVLNSNETSKARVTVVDLNGKEMIIENVVLGGGALNTVDVSNLAKGIYLVNIQTDSKRYTQKWIKK